MTFLKGARVKVVDDLFNDVLGKHSSTGRLGTVQWDDRTDLMPIWVLLDGDDEASCFDAHELALEPVEPTAPQTLTILGHLQKVGDISGLEAQSLYKCRSLPRRIADLKDLGWNIKSTLKTDATGQRYVRYSLVTE